MMSGVEHFSRTYFHMYVVFDKYLFRSTSHFKSHSLFALELLELLLADKDLPSADLLQR